MWSGVYNFFLLSFYFWLIFCYIRFLCSHINPLGLFEFVILSYSTLIIKIILPCFILLLLYSYFLHLYILPSEICVDLKEIKWIWLVFSHIATSHLSTIYFKSIFLYQFEMLPWPSTKLKHFKKYIFGLSMIFQFHNYYSFIMCVDVK